MTTTSNATRAVSGQQKPADRLKGEFSNLLGAVGERALGSALDRVNGTVGRLNDYVADGGGPGLMAAVTGAKDIAEGKSPAKALLGAGATGAKEQVKNLFGGGDGKGGQGNKLKVTNIVETTDVGVPVRVAYNQWTQFRDFPSFMKKVESAEQEADEKLHWRAQIFWSHRDWESTILKQIPDEMIVWRSKGDKGYVDGSVTFHELAPSMTRILLVLEYNPKGFFEQTGNLFRAQGRRARLELKHFRRHVMTQGLLNPDEVEGWRGVIEDGEVVKDHETAVAEEQGEHGGEAGDEYPEEPGGEYQAGDDHPEHEYEDEDEEQDGEGYESGPRAAGETEAGYETADEETGQDEAAGDGGDQYETAEDEADQYETAAAGSDDEEYEQEGRPLRAERPRRAQPVTRRTRAGASERRG